jgi:hypothetical protein
VKLFPLKAKGLGLLKDLEGSNLNSFAATLSFDMEGLGI